jgi:hypothetical protein
MAIVHGTTPAAWVAKESPGRGGNPEIPAPVPAERRNLHDPAIWRRRERVECEGLSHGIVSFQAIVDGKPDRTLIIAKGGIDRVAIAAAIEFAFKILPLNRPGGPMVSNDLGSMRPQPE